MSKETIPYTSTDISALAKSLRKQLAACDSFPTHVEMLNILAKANGYRNFQHLKGEAPHLTEKPRQLEVVIPRKLRPFMTEDYVLHAWPVKFAIQKLCFWFFACRFQYQQRYTEREVNEVIKQFISFGDFALLRRELCNHKLLKRTDDGRHYWRAAAAPPDELTPLSDYWPG